MNENKVIDKFTSDFLEYLNNDSVGALLIDDVWGVGKTFTTKEIITTEKYKGKINKIKYYSILNIENFNNDINIKDYVLNGLRKIHTKKYISFTLEKKTKFRIEVPDILIDISNMIIGIIVLSFSSVLKILQINHDINEIKNGIKNFFTKFHKHTILDNEIVLIIDEIERKRNTLELKEILLKIIELQESNTIKIILIMNSIELNEYEKELLDRWSEKVIYKKINLKNNNNLSTITGINKVYELIGNGIINYFLSEESRNIRILRKAELFIKDVDNIIINYLGETIYNNNKNYIDAILIKFLINVLMYLNHKKELNLFFENGRDLYKAIDMYFNNDDSLIIDFINKLFFNYEKDYIYENSGLNPQDKIRINFINKSFNDFYNDLTLNLKNVNLLNINYLKIKDNYIYKHKCKYTDEILNTLEGIISFSNADMDLLLNLKTVDYWKEYHFSIINWMEFILLLMKEKFKYIIIYLEKINKKDIISYERAYVDYLILEIIDKTENDVKLYKNNLKLIRHDIFSKRIEKAMINEYNSFLEILNDEYLLKFTVHDNIRIVQHNLNNNFNKIDLIGELANNSKHAKGMDIETSILRLKQIDNDIIYKIEKLIDDREKLILKWTIEGNDKKNQIDKIWEENFEIEKAISNIKQNEINNVIQYMEHDELKREIEFENERNRLKINQDDLEKSKESFLNHLENSTYTDTISDSIMYDLINGKF